MIITPPNKLEKSEVALAGQDPKPLWNNITEISIKFPTELPHVASSVEGVLGSFVDLAENWAEKLSWEAI